MATADQETGITFFANPFLRCQYVYPDSKLTCGRRAVGMVGNPTTPAGLSVALGVAQAGVTLGNPTTGRNWPCYHVADRISVCDNWTSTSGCTHTTEQRAQHSNPLSFEGTRR